MRASYSYVLQTSEPNVVYQTNVSVLAGSEEEARSKAQQLLGTAKKAAELKLVQITDVELMKQRLEQTFLREPPPRWMGEE